MPADSTSHNFEFVGNCIHQTTATDGPRHGALAVQDGNAGGGTSGGLMHHLVGMTVHASQSPPTPPVLSPGLGLGQW